MTDRAWLADQAARERALDPATSFIVQAPAGSGKTGLLTQRYLVLLARADHPEEVVAITFTRKAASEMRERVIGALDGARNRPCPDDPHKAHTWSLARTVLERDIALAWHLALNPERLRIHTIDSFCSGLARQMPYLSRFGAPPSAVRDAERLYVEAAHTALAHLESSDRWSAAVERLLRHLDNNVPAAVRLVADMLARRDQWLRHLADGRSPGERRAHLEQALTMLNAAALTQLAALAPAGLAAEAAALACYASSQLGGQPDHPVHAGATLASWPGAGLEQRARWEALAALLLTGEGEWRKAVNVRNGFPARDPGASPADNARREEMKRRMIALLDAVRADDAFRVALAAVMTLPAPRYDAAAWEAVEALIEVVMLAVLELKLVFTQRGEADFTEIAQGAINALGRPESPTDLALHLDYRIRHLLVDEFQDTSISQFDLLGRLTAGWQAGDGRTLFVVGDPMQSIYRFRQAEVGLYLRARHEGVGGVRLTPLTLSVNFRSQQGIVDWVNAAFLRVLPAAENIAAGAVPCAPAVAHHPAGTVPAVAVHAFVGDEIEAEPRRVVELVAAARVEAPQGKIAVLVRSRTHLAQIAPLLKQQGLGFRAVEIEPLVDRPVVQDLLALTRALGHLADRAAWLAIVRAPWCGLTLADLTVLAGDAHDTALWVQMHDETRVARLSDDGRERLRRTRSVLDRGLAAMGRERLRRVVEGTWLALGGAACVESETDLEDARVFLELLDDLDEGGGLADSALLGERMRELYALPDVQVGDALQLMTIHKAKGLEFDTVILPGLGRVPRGDDAPLLRWMEAPRAAGDGTADLLLAPIRATGAEPDPLYEYLRLLDAEKARHESGRLLYVATTRAMRRLHLLGSVGRDPGGRMRTPPPRSLLALLWPVVEPAFLAAEHAPRSSPLSQPAASRGNLRRLVPGWSLPPMPPPAPWQAGAQPPLPVERPAVEFDWASETIRHVGTVVHQTLQQIGRDGLTRWPAARVATLTGGFRLALARRGVPPAKLDQAVARVTEALARTLADPRASWLFDTTHGQARSEYALTIADRGRVVTTVIDRTFVDGDGVRWIIDFKTSTHSGGGLEEFLDREQQRYRAQLERYATVLHRLESRPIRLGLYFPLLGGWREWPAG